MPLPGRTRIALARLVARHEFDPQIADPDLGVGEWNVGFCLQGHDDWQLQSRRIDFRQDRRWDRHCVVRQTDVPWSAKRDDGADQRAVHAPKLKMRIGGQSCQSHTDLEQANLSRCEMA